MSNTKIANFQSDNFEELSDEDAVAIVGGTTVTVDAPGNKIVYDTNPIALINFVLGIPGQLGN